MEFNSGFKGLRVDVGDGHIGSLSMKRGRIINSELLEIIAG